MVKFSIISMWRYFDYNNNEILSKFFCGHEYVSCENAEILFIGSFVNETMYNTIKSLNCKKILYITEPVGMRIHRFAFNLLRDNMVDFVFGCYYPNKYPLYANNITDADIFTSVNNYVKNCDLNKEFCALINRHDNFNTRTPIYNRLIKIDTIICPSKLFNNCGNGELNKIGNSEYLKKFKFNICPENKKPTFNGYITEKLMNACLGGAIPIYYGHFDEEDAKIFNKNRILFYDPLNNQSIDNVENKIKHLLSDSSEFENFYRQDVFCDTAYETIIGFENNIKKIINSMIE